MDSLQQPQQTMPQQQMPAQPMPNPVPQPMQPSVPQPIEQHKSHFLRDLSLFILFLIIVGGAAYGGYYYGQKTSTPAAETTRMPIVPTQPVATTSPTLSTASWQTYTSPTLGYSLKYPQDWTLNPNYVDPQGGLDKNTIALTDPQGDILQFDFGYRPLGLPPHVFKTQNITIDGQSMIKTYNDNCGFGPNGLTAVTQCKGKQTEFYLITYNVPGALTNDPTVVDSTSGTRDYDWSTGPQSVGLGISNFHGKPSYLAFVLKNRLSATNITAFQSTDIILDQIIASFKFTK